MGSNQVPVASTVMFCVFFKSYKAIKDNLKIGKDH